MDRSNFCARHEVIGQRGVAVAETSTVLNSIEAEAKKMGQQNLWEGKFLIVRQAEKEPAEKFSDVPGDPQKWEYVTRTTGRPVVAIVATDVDDRLVLVEQFRPPVNSNVIELPAGLAGDIAGSEDEPLLNAAKRELEEETGYTAAPDQWRRVTSGLSSAGLTDESTEVFAVRNVVKTSSGGGVGSEAIAIHLVPQEGLMAWLEGKGLPYDLKLLGAVYAAKET